MNFGRRALNPCNTNLIYQQTIQKERKGQLM